ncbi:MAG: ATP-binding protein [Thermodesulfobacteriota bacterium]
MNFSRRPSFQGTFHYPLYIFAVLTVLIAILVVNGFFEIQRTRNQLFHILENEALLVVKGLEKNTGNIFALLSRDPASPAGLPLMEGSEEFLGIEDLVIEYLINLALELDQRDRNQETSPATGKGPKKQSEISRIYFLKTDGRPEGGKGLPFPLDATPSFFQEVISGKSRLAVYRGQGPNRYLLPLAVAVARRNNAGIIMIALSADEYLNLSRQIALQSLLEDLGGKGNITYLQVEDGGGKVMAESGQPFITPSAQELQRKAVGSGNAGLFWVEGAKGEFLEVLQPFHPGGKPMGRVRVGLSLKEINPILDQSRRNIFLMGVILFGSGLISLFFIFRLQSRHLQKIKEMEEKIHLQEELSAMGQLAAGVAHEIKNPLNAISLVVQRLEKEFSPPDPEDRKEYQRFTHIVGGEISRVNRIINDFLLIARPLESKKGGHSLLDILNYCLEVLETEFKTRGIRLIKEVEESLPLLWCDRFQLTQAFLNIFNNALESMPEGGELKLSIRISDFGFRKVESEKQSAAIRKSSAAPSGPASSGSLFKSSAAPSGPASEIEIRVADTGKGISPENLKKVFAPYFTTKEKGLGLGLAITQRMIQAHQGILEMESREGEGTTVIVRLPVLRDPIEA